MKLLQKARLARLRGRNTVRAKPRLRVPTYATFERACLLTGLDPDHVRQGKAQFSDARLADVYADGQALFDLVLENAADFDLAALPKHLAEEVAGVVAAHFFVFALSTFRQQSLSLRDMLSAQMSTGSRADPARPLAALSRRFRTESTKP